MLVWSPLLEWVAFIWLVVESLLWFSKASGYYDAFAGMSKSDMYTHAVVVIGCALVFLPL